MAFVVIILQALVVAIWIAVLGRVLMSWIDPGAARPVSQFLYRITEPMLAPIRNVLPRTGQIDFAPLVLLFGLGLLMRLVLAL